MEKAAKIIDSDITKLFTRFLKDNNIPLNSQAFYFTFGKLRDLLPTHLLISYYLLELRDNGLFIDDNYYSFKRKSLKLKWIEVIKKNYVNVLRDSDVKEFISLRNNKIRFTTCSLRGLEEREQKLKRFLTPVPKIIQTL